MSVIDTSQWKEFRVGKLLGPAKHGNWIDPKSLDENEDGYQIVSASTINNGVSIERYSILNEKYIVPARVITWGKQSPFFAYQKEPTISGQGVYYYDVSQQTPQQALFLCGVMQSRIAGKYSYQDCLIGCKCDKETIYLPATSSGEPDWDYMDSFMKKILDEEEAAAEQLAALTPESGDDGHFLDVSGWKAFHLYDIFHIDMGNKFDRGKMPTGDEINFVGRTGLNNGINATCGAVDKVEPYPPGLITLALGGTIGACFVQPKKFYTSQNVVVLNPKQKLSFAVKTFISAIIWRVSDMYYDAFSNELNRHIKTDFVFWLPVTSDGQPNWAWMEQYMQRQMNKVELLSKHLIQFL